jgi:hypothetical protein
MSILLQWNRIIVQTPAGWPAFAGHDTCSLVAFGEGGEDDARRKEAAVGLSGRVSGPDSIGTKHFDNLYGPRPSGRAAALILSLSKDGGGAPQERATQVKPRACADVDFTSVEPQHCAEPSWVARIRRP